MQNIRHIQPRLLLFFALSSVALSTVHFASVAAAQSHPAVPAQPPVPAQRPAAPAASAPISDRDFAATQDQLIKLLRLSPTLTSVVEHDPSLLSNQDYVSRNNPQLAQFLAAHPEVSRNPDFYLFTRVQHDDGSPNEELERAVWPEFSQPRRSDPIDTLGPFFALLAFAAFLSALVWIIRQILENRRWNKIFKLQSDVHGRLIDKFGTSQDLAAYMSTEAGRRFLEAAPFSAGMEHEQRVPNAIARVLTPLQIGIVMVLLGVGLFLLRHASPDTELPMLIFGTVVLMPGLGFIISAGVTWVLAHRLGLMPDSPEAIIKSPFDSRESR